MLNRISLFHVLLDVPFLAIGRKTPTPHRQLLFPRSLRLRLGAAHGFLCLDPQLLQPVDGLEAPGENHWDSMCRYDVSTQCDEFCEVELKQGLHAITASFCSFGGSYPTTSLTTRIYTEDHSNTVTTKYMARLYHALQCYIVFVDKSLI